MNSRLLATFLAVQTATTAISPLGFAQSPVAMTWQSPVAMTWEDRLDEVVGQQVEILDAATGAPVKFSQMFGPNPTFPNRALIRPVHDRYLSKAFTYFLEARGNHDFGLEVHRNYGSASPDKTLFTWTPLNFTPPFDDSFVEPSLWFSDRFREKVAFFRRIKTLGTLDDNYKKIKTLAQDRSDPSAAMSVFLVSLVAIGGSVALESVGSRGRAKLLAWPLMFLGASGLTLSAGLLGLNQDRADLEVSLKTIDETFANRSENATNEQVQLALENRATELLRSTSIRTDGAVKTPYANLACAVSIMSVLAPLLLVGFSRMGLNGGMTTESRMLLSAMVLIVSVTAYALGVLSAKDPKAIDPIELNKAVSSEAERLFEPMK